MPLVLRRGEEVEQYLGLGALRLAHVAFRVDATPGVARSDRADDDRYTLGPVLDLTSVPVVVSSAVLVEQAEPGLDVVEELDRVGTRSSLLVKVGQVRVGVRVLEQTRSSSHCGGVKVGV